MVAIVEGIPPEAFVPYQFKVAFGRAIACNAAVMLFLQRVLLYAGAGGG